MRVFGDWFDSEDLWNTAGNVLSEEGGWVGGAVG